MYCKRLDPDENLVRLVSIKAYTELGAVTDLLLVYIQKPGIRGSNQYWLLDALHTPTTGGPARRHLPRSQSI